jgi:Fe-S cluster biosynthesis and repair protein YggX
MISANANSLANDSRLRSDEYDPQMTRTEFANSIFAQITPDAWKAW